MLRHPLRVVIRRALALPVLATVLSVTVAAPVAAQLRDPADWEVLVPRTTLVDLVTWDGRLAGASENGGVLVFDPTDDTIGSLGTQEGLSSHRVQCLAVDVDGALWVGTGDAGIVKVEPSGVTRAVTSLQQQIDVRGIATDGSFVYFGGPEGGGTLVSDLPEQRFTSDGGMPSDLVQAVAAAGGRAWFGTDDGVAVFDRAANRLDVVESGLVDRDVRALWADEDGVLLGTRSGLLRLDESDPETLSWTAFEPALEQWVVDVVREGEDVAVLAPDNRIWRLAPGAAAWSLVDEVDTEETSLRALAFGPEGELWSAGARLDRTEKNADPTSLFRRLDGRVSPPVRGLFGSNVRALAPDGSGGLWIGGFPVFDGLTHWRDDGGVVVYARPETGESDGWIDGTKNAIVPDDDGNLWVSSFTGGLTRFRPAPGDDPDAATYLHLTPDTSPLRSVRIRAAARDPKGRLWFGSSGEAVVGDRNVGLDILVDPSAPLDPGSWLKVTPENSLLAGNGIWSIDFQGDDVVWITIENEGVQRWDYDSVLGTGDVEPLALTEATAWRDIEELPEVGGVGILLEKPRDLAIGPDGRVWLATDGAGLFGFDYDSFAIPSADVERYFSARPLAPFMSDKLTAVEVDVSGDVWSGGEVGLQRVRETASGPEVEAWTDVPGFLAFGLGERFFPDIISPMAGSSVVRLFLDEERRRLYVGTTGGLSRLSLDAEDTGESGGLDVLLRPNPIRDGDALFLDGFEGTVDVEIYTLTGVLLHTTRGAIAGESVWDTRNIADNRVASGLYVVRVVRDGASVLKTLAVER